MKDLYRAIGLDGMEHAADEIERAIKSTRKHDSVAAEAASQILLNIDRRVHYDRLYSVLKAVGEVRANIGCTYGPNWKASDCSDFDSNPTLSPQVPRKAASDSGGLRVGPVPIVVSGILIILVGLVTLYNDGLSSEPSSSKIKNLDLSELEGLEAIEEEQHSESSSVGSPVSEQLLVRRDAVWKMVLGRIRRAGLQPDSTVSDIVARVIDGDSLALPETGVVLYPGSSSGVAPFEVRTSRGVNYYVKILEWSTKNEIASIFVRGGDSFEMKLPVGSYEIRYASGTDWYGPVIDFADDAAYFKCDDRFDFTRTLNGYSGYTVELIVQTGGNLQTISLDENGF